MVNGRKWFYHGSKVLMEWTWHMWDNTHCKTYKLSSFCYQISSLVWPKQPYLNNWTKALFSSSKTLALMSHVKTAGRQNIRVHKLVLHQCKRGPLVHRAGSEVTNLALSVGPSHFPLWHLSQTTGAVKAGHQTPVNLRVFTVCCYHMIQWASRAPTISQLIN